MSEIIRRTGGLVKTAKAVGRHHATILGWTRVPPQHVKAVSAASGIPAHELRPDLWDPPNTGAPSVNDSPKPKGKRTASSSDADTDASAASARAA